MLFKRKRIHKKLGNNWIRLFVFKRCGCSMCTNIDRCHIPILIRRNRIGQFQDMCIYYPPPPLVISSGFFVYVINTEVSTFSEEDIINYYNVV